MIHFLFLRGRDSVSVDQPSREDRRMKRERDNERERKRERQRERERERERWWG